jgi:hypothetical protein
LLCGEQAKRCRPRYKQFTLGESKNTMFKPNQHSPSYMQQLDEWISKAVIWPLFDAFKEVQEFKSDEPFDQAAQAVKKAIREKVLESYHNGQAIGPKRTGRNWLRKKA